MPGRLQPAPGADPFRTAEGAEVRAESLTSDPALINRLRAGETSTRDPI